MGDQHGDADFQFVVATVTNPRVPEDKAGRALIRKQAMKQSSEEQPGKAIRDRESNSEDARQSRYIAEKYLDFEGEGGRQGLYHYGNGFKGGPSLEDWFFSKTTIYSSLSPQRNQEAVVSYSFNIFDLSSLASLYIGRYAGRALSADPSWLSSLLRSKQWSYLAYLPSRYGRIACLNDAVDCIIARVRQILVPNDRNLQSTVIPSYVPALKSLQKALDNPDECFEPELFCTIEVTSQKLLNPSCSMTGWIHHAAGAAHVIRMRGPRNYETEFEKTLLMARANPIMLSRIRDTNTTEDPSFIKAALAARELRTELLHWFCTYGPSLALRPEQSVSASERDKRSEIRSTYLSCIMLVTRLLGATSTRERAALEDEAQEYANQTLQLEYEIKPLSPHALLYLELTSVMARSIRSTFVDWKGVHEQEGVDCVIERAEFDRWTSLLGFMPS